MMRPYPVFLIGLERRRCVVIGDDHEAERKTGELIDCGARPAVIATTPGETLRQWGDQGKIVLHRRGYRPGDLAGAFLVVSANQDEAQSDAIRAEAQREKALVCVMDQPRRCDFIAGARVRRGPLQIAISTSGCGPALAVRLRQRLEREIGPEYGRLLELMAELRPRVGARWQEFSDRRDRWYRVVDSEALAWIADRREAEACHLLREILELG